MTKRLITALVAAAFSAAAAVRVGTEAMASAYADTHTLSEIRVGTELAFSLAAPVTYEVAWFKLDDNADSKTVLDSSVNAVVATNLTANTSTLSVAGKIGTALAYTGVERTVTQTPAVIDAIRASESYSIAFWCRREAGEDHASWFNFQSPDCESLSYFNKDGNVLFWYLLGPGDVPHIVAYFYMTPATWFHFAYVRHQSDFRIFVNGQAHDSFTGTPTHAPPLFFAFGCYSSLPMNIRTMDDFRLYDFALSSTDVAFLYNAGSGTAAPLVPVPDVYVTVTFDATAGGAVDPATKSVVLGAAYGGLPVPTKAGYVFAAWYSDDLVANVAANTVVTIATPHTLTATYTVAPSTVTVYFDPGNGTVDYASAEYTPGSTYGSLPQAYNYDGAYVFAYWRNEAYEQISTESAVPQSSHTLYAEYYYFAPPPVCTLTLDANGGTVDPQSIGGVTAGTPYEYVGLPTPSMDGYTFAGWYSPYWSVIVGNGSYYSVSGDETLVAQWY